jgi:uncharacterized protein YdiU (UPF0061 family)
VAPQRSNPLLALRHHGYPFGTYNPFLGDGRGFLDGQLRDRRGDLQDLGSKGSAATPWSRGGDGRFTLKGGVREVIASEALQRLVVTPHPPALRHLRAAAASAPAPGPEAIDQRDDWEPLRDWLERCGSSHSAESGCSALQPPQPGSV